MQKKKKCLHKFIQANLRLRKRLISPNMFTALSYEASSTNLAITSDLLSCVCV